MCNFQKQKKVEKDRGLFNRNIKPIWVVYNSFFYMCTENLALHKPAWQSSTRLPGYTGAERAVDGRYTKLWFYEGQCAMSDSYQTIAEWRVDLGGVKNIHHVFLQHATGISMLGILFLKIIDCYLKEIDVKLIITASGINVGWMKIVYLKYKSCILVINL